MCPVKVYVYSLSDNEWYYVAFKDLGKTRWVGKKVWDRMVPNKDNEMQIDRLKRLSAAHRKRNEATLISDRPLIDNFKGKGQGLTILLYGPPGVGKTMLAECLSEHQERPLYRVDLGRLTEDTGRREARIEETFRQAHFWNAILLFDEAEVILAERTQENMRQSAWVAGLCLQRWRPRFFNCSVGLSWLTHECSLPPQNRIFRGLALPYH